MNEHPTSKLSRRGALGAGIGVAAAMIAPPALAQSAVTLRFGHAVEVGGIFTILFDEMAARVRERTNGQVTIRTFPGEQLGTEQENHQSDETGRRRYDSAVNGIARDDIGPAFRNGECAFPVAQLG